MIKTLDTSTKTPLGPPPHTPLNEMTNDYWFGYPRSNTTEAAKRIGGWTACRAMLTKQHPRCLFRLHRDAGHLRDMQVEVLFQGKHRWLPYDTFGSVADEFGVVVGSPTDATSHFE